MLDLLSKILGPHRAVSFYVFLQNRGLAILALVAFVAIVSTLLFKTGPGEHEHQAFMSLPVVSSKPVGNEIGTGLIATLRLPDGEVVTVTTTEDNLAATVTETACIEIRRFVETGEPRYRLKFPRNCTGD